MKKLIIFAFLFLVSCSSNNFDYPEKEVVKVQSSVSPTIGKLAGETSAGLLFLAFEEQLLEFLRGQLGSTRFPLGQLGSTRFPLLAVGSGREDRPIMSMTSWVVWRGRSCLP